MYTKIIQFGNSKGVIIPSSVLKNLDLSVGDHLEIKTANSKITLEKAYEELEIKLADVFSNYEKEHGPIKNDPVREVSWGKKRGNEEW
ncbi:MAG: hypothetical protein MJ207_02075 [Bacilli bacterium]|nr:hypothetical protein [Bacilli bacterium]